MVIDKDYDNIKENYKEFNNYNCFIVYRLALDNYIEYSSNLYQTYNTVIE